MRSWLALTRRTACVRPAIHPLPRTVGRSHEGRRPNQSERAVAPSPSGKRCWTWGGRRPCCHGAVEQTLREPGHGPVEVVESLFDLVVGAVLVQRARGGIPLPVEFVQVLTQPVDQSGALADQASR